IWEQAIWRDMLGPGEQRTMFVEHTVDAFLRGDTLTRYRAHAIGRQNGWLSANDIRGMENLNPLPDEQGDMYLVPTNMLPADQLAELDQQENQPGAGGGAPTTAGDGSPQPARATRTAGLLAGLTAEALERAFVPALSD